MRTLILDDEEPIVHMCQRSAICVKGLREGRAHGVSLHALSGRTHLSRVGASRSADHGHAHARARRHDCRRKARRLQPNIFTRIITAHTSRYPIEDQMADGTADIMFKPFHMNELRTRLALAKRRRDLIDRLH